MTKSPVERVDQRIQLKLNDVWTFVPGIVKYIDSTTMMCAVDIKVQTEKGTFSRIYNVPIMFPKAGNNIILFPVRVNDVVAVAFGKLPLREALIDANIALVNSQLQFEYNYAFVIGGLVLDTQKGSTIYDDVTYALPTSGMIIASDEKITIKAPEVVIKSGVAPLRRRHVMEDDFWGDSLDTKWATTFVGSGSIVVVSAENGVVNLATGAAVNDESRMHFGTIVMYTRALSVIMEARVKLSTLTNIRVIFGFMSGDTGVGAATNTNHAAIRFYEGFETVFMLSTADGTTQSISSTGVTVDSNYHTFRLELRSADVRLYIDDILRVTKTTNLPNSSAKMMPFFGVFTGASSTRSMDVDYCYVEQNR